ncbi:GNAT family N-acetyltransferase [Shewanella sp. GXUN23E]|uniref:GNAT family N-acetyltransferase n=1 Tax=Shewanella sp. GXUN23E TaxID=3422498 RepID=UPI003D7E93B8
MEASILYTDRLIIRPIEPRDWPAFRELHLDAEVNRFVREVQSEAEIIAKFQGRLQPWYYASGDWLTLVVETLDGEFVGFTGFYCQDAFSKRVEVGYMMSPLQQGKGYASESLRAVVDWACLRFEVHKFVGCCATQNQASVKVMQKCGFTQEGLMRSHYRIGDIWVDEYVMGLVASER